MYNYIHRTVEALRKKYDSGNIYEIIAQSNTHLKRFSDLGKLKGFYMPVLRQHYIGLNAMLPDPEQEMTAAHEFAHSLLHRNIPDLMQDFDLFNIISQTEYEANLFAAEFLITDHDVIECADEGMDYIEMSKTMSRDPRLMLFKLHSMNQRCGYGFNLSDAPDSLFLKRT